VSSNKPIAGNVRNAMRENRSTLVPKVNSKRPRHYGEPDHVVIACEPDDGVIA